MSDSQSQTSVRVDQQAQQFFSVGLVLMLMGAGLSVTALLLMPHLAGGGRLLLVLAGLALTGGLSWLAARQCWPALQADTHGR